MKGRGEQYSTSGRVKGDADRDPFRNLFVDNIPTSWTVDEMVTLFSQYGRVVSALIMRHGNPKGLRRGFAEMAEREEAASAVKELNGKELETRHEPLEVRFATISHENRQQKKEAKMESQTAKKTYRQRRKVRTGKIPYGEELHEYLVEAMENVHVQDRNELVARHYLQRFHEREHKCQRCWLMKEFCICSTIRPFSALKHRIFVFMHYKEYGRATNTGKILYLSSEGARMFVASMKEHEEEMFDLLRNEPEKSFVLFPSTSSITTDVLLRRFGVLGDLDETKICKTAASDEKDEIISSMEQSAKPERLAEAEAERYGRELGVRNKSKGARKRFDVRFHGLASFGGVTPPERAAAWERLPPLNICVVDGTWSNAKGMHRRIPQDIQRLQLTMETTQEDVKHGVNIDRISTLGASMRLFHELGAPAEVLNQLSDYLKISVDAARLQNHCPPVYKMPFEFSSGGKSTEVKVTQGKGAGQGDGKDDLRGPWRDAK